MKGLRARGGSIVDEQWTNGHITKATVYSTIGGTLRLRSYIPLKGKNLREATGPCPNDLLQPANIREPLRSPELKDFQMLNNKLVFEYDLDTQPGHSYVFKGDTTLPNPYLESSLSPVTR